MSTAIHSECFGLFTYTHDIFLVALEKISAVITVHIERVQNLCKRQIEGGEIETLICESTEDD